MGNGEEVHFDSGSKCCRRLNGVDQALVSEFQKRVRPDTGIIWSVNGVPSRADHDRFSFKA